MRYCGTEAEAISMSDELTIELGRKYTSGKECFPSIVTTGDIVKTTLSPDFDPDHAAFLMAGASGPCRFGQYSKLHRLVLDEIGLQKVPLLLLDQTKNFHQHMATFGKGFWHRVWQAIVILDSIHKMLLEKRPYEVNQGETDAVYQEWLKLLIEVVERDSDGFESFAHRVKDAFDVVKIDKSIPKPRIGIIGEIFVRSNEFANDFVVRKLENLGAQCSLPPFEEWLDYIAYQRRRRSRLRLEGGWRDWAKQKLTEFIEERVAEPLRRPFDGAIEHFARELPTSEILNRSRPYLSPVLEGEAVLSIGRAVEYAEHGFDGIVNVMPFGCMPGTIVSMLLHRLRHDHGLPVFNLVVDGTRDPGQDIRLEAFFHQCCDHMHRHHR